jgi:hypothetical protein
MRVANNSIDELLIVRQDPGPAPLGIHGASTDHHLLPFEYRQLIAPQAQQRPSNREQ